MADIFRVNKHDQTNNRYSFDQTRVSKITEIFFNNLKINALFQNKKKLKKNRFFNLHVST